MATNNTSRLPEEESDRIAEKCFEKFGMWISDAFPDVLADRIAEKVVAKMKELFLQDKPERKLLTLSDANVDRIARAVAPMAADRVILAITSKAEEKLKRRGKAKEAE